MTAQRSTVPPHPFTPDPDLPPDHRGERLCRPPCGLPRDNARHTMPDVPEQAEHLRRYGETE